MSIPVIKSVCDMRQVCGFLQVLRFPQPIKLTNDITEILLKVALNTTTLNVKQNTCYFTVGGNSKNMNNIVLTLVGQT
jgi:hypothetical protein